LNIPSTVGACILWVWKYSLKRLHFDSYFGQNCGTFRKEILYGCWKMTFVVLTNGKFSWLLQLLLWFLLSLAMMAFANMSIFLGIALKVNFSEAWYYSAFNKNINWLTFIQSVVFPCFCLILLGFFFGRVNPSQLELLIINKATNLAVNNKLSR